MKPVTIVVIVIVCLLALSLLGFVLSLIGAITSFLWRFVFSPIGIIAAIILIVYLVKGKSGSR